MNEFLSLSIKELSVKLRSRELRVKTLLDIYFKRIDTHNPGIGAFLSLNREQAYQQADKYDAAFDSGDPLPLLTGIPIAIKDNINIKGMKTTCASKILENFVSPYDAKVITRLKKHGLIPIGKTNLDEFAMGSSTENSAFVKTVNPWNKAHVPGGSSGGSAACISARLAPLALGSDTGGSIRQPAALCGCVGLKPTYGRVSRYGLVAFASSLDQIGPLSRSIEDAAYLMNAICGFDKNDSTSANTAVPDFTKNLGQDIRDLKIAIPNELFGETISPGIRNLLEKAMDVLKQQGAVIEPVTLETQKYVMPAYYIIAPAEASANLARFDGVRYGFRHKNAKNLVQMVKESRGLGFGPEVTRRILLGTYALSSGYYDAYYVKAQKVRSLIKKEYSELLKSYDIILTPTTPSPAFKFGEKVDDPLSMYLEDIATLPVNLTGLPAVSIPAGFLSGLPIGMQLIGRAFDEETLLKTGYVFQQCTEYHKQFPELEDV